MTRRDYRETGRTVNPVITFPYVLLHARRLRRRARFVRSSSFFSLGFVPSPREDNALFFFSFAKSLLPDRGDPDLHVDYSQRSLTVSDPATNNLSQRRRAKYGNNNDIVIIRTLLSRFDDKGEGRPESYFTVQPGNRLCILLSDMGCNKTIIQNWIRYN